MTDTAQPAQTKLTSKSSLLYSPQIQSLLRLLPVLIPLAICLITGVQGINLGHHWDETPNIDGAVKALKSGILLPQGYDYPMMLFWLILASTLPTMPAALKSRTFSTPAYMMTEPFLLQARTIFLIVSALAIVWVYLTVLNWRKNWKEALLAASLLGLSWEMNYHIRWVTPDGLMMMFSALTMLLLITAFSRREHYWIWLKLAAVGAGLTAGSKYPGALVFLSVLLTFFFLNDQRALRRWVLRGIELCFWAGLAYLITTPGTVLQPFDFVIAMRDMARQYANGHEVHTIHGGLEHLIRIIQYFSTMALSPFAPIALVLSAFSIVGTYAAIRENWKLAAVLLVYPVLYLLYFSLQRAMIIRNYLFVIPFLALFSARGVFYLIERLHIRWAQVTAGVLITGMLIANAGWLFYAAQTIQDRGTDRFAKEFAAFVEANPNTRFYVSKQVEQSLTSVSNKAHTNVSDTSINGADVVAFYAYSNANECIPANRPEIFLRWFGPLEINYAYYTTWPGNDRIVLMRADQAQPYEGCIFKSQ